MATPTPRNTPPASPQTPCPMCEGTGYWTPDVPLGHPDRGRIMRCACKRDEDRARRYRVARAIGDLPEAEALALVTFATYDRSRFPAAYETLRTFADQPHGWVVLTGPQGMGKSHLLQATAQALLERGVPAVYAVAPRLLRRLRDAMHGEDRQTAATPISLSYLEQVDVLLVDDLGAESESTWTDEQLFQVLDWRYAHRLPTVLASNLAPEDFEPRLASRAQDRSLAQVLEMVDDLDYRLSSAQAHKAQQARQNRQNRQNHSGKGGR